MDNASAARAAAAIARVGHAVTFTRTGLVPPNPNPTTIASATVKAVVSGYAPSELINGITLGSRRVIVSAQALAAASFPLPVVKGDKVTASGKELRVEAVDPDHREYIGCLDITALGA